MDVVTKTLLCCIMGSVGSSIFNAWKSGYLGFCYTGISAKIYHWSAPSKLKDHPGVPFFSFRNFLEIETGKQEWCSHRAVIFRGRLRHHLTDTEGINLCCCIPAFMVLWFYLKFGRCNKTVSLAFTVDDLALNCCLWGALSVCLPPWTINSRPD